MVTEIEKRILEILQNNKITKFVGIYNLLPDEYRISIRRIHYITRKLESEGYVEIARIALTDKGKKALKEAGDEPV